MTEWNRRIFEPGVVPALSAAVAYALAATVLTARLLVAGGAPPRWLPPGAMSRERPGALSRAGRRLLRGASHGRRLAPVHP